MDPFALGLGALHRGPASVNAIFEREGSVPRPIRVIHGKPDRDAGFGEGRIIQGSNSFEVRLTDAPCGRRGDTITVGGIVYEILGDGTIDVEGLSWTAGAEPL